MPKYKARFKENPSKCQKPSFLFLFGDYGDSSDSPRCEALEVRE